MASMPDQASDAFNLFQARTQDPSPKLPPLRPKRTIRQAPRPACLSYRRGSFRSAQEQPKIQPSTCTNDPQQRPEPSPSPNNLWDRSEHEAFQYFTGQAMAWFDPNRTPWPSDGHMDTIWSPLMLQMMESEPTIKQILLAWARQRSLNGSLLPLDTSEASAVVGTRQQIDLSVMLVACLMFCVLDSIRGDKDVYLRRLQSGLRILDDYSRVSPSLAGTVCDSMIAGCVRPFFVTLNLNLTMTLQFELWRPGEKVVDRLVKLRETNRVLKTWN